MDMNYWNKYYGEYTPADQPSSFAQFCADRFDDSTGRIFDIGCGDGRDTLFFATRSILATGIEQSKVAIEKNEKRKLELGLSANFIVSDFSTCDYDSLSEGFYSLYSRFTLHAINYEEESRFFDHINRLNSIKYIFIEARSIRDSLYGKGDNVGLHEYVTSHYRRFIDPVALKKMLEINFNVIYFEEAQGFAKIESEDPCLIRVIAKRK